MEMAMDFKGTQAPFPEGDRFALSARSESAIFTRKFGSPSVTLLKEDRKERP